MEAALQPPRTWPAAAADSKGDNHHTVKAWQALGSAGVVTGRHGRGVASGDVHANSASERRADAQGWRDYGSSSNGIDAGSFPPRQSAAGRSGIENVALGEQDATQEREAARKSAARAAAATASAAAVAALARTREAGWGEREAGVFAGIAGQVDRSGIHESQRAAASAGEGRLRALTSKLRHPLVDVRSRAISNLSGKLSLGLLSPSDLPESEPAFFSDVVALLSEAASSLSSSGNRSASPSPGDGGGASTAGPVLNLCLQLAKDPSSRALLAGQGAAAPLSRICMAATEPTSVLTSKDGAGGGGSRGGWPELRSFAAEVLALVELSPGNRTGLVEEAVLVGDESARPEAVFPRQLLSEPPKEMQKGERWPSARRQREQQQQRQSDKGKDEDACMLYGDGSEPRWPLWTKELVDGRLLSADNASAASLVACLTAGWRFPHVRLVRSEESALFDFEVRFRTADSPAGESGLLRCLRHLRDEIIEDYPPEVLLQRPGSFGRLLSLLRTPSASELVIEEALSAATRLVERLVRSARLHRDSAFRPPPSASSSPDVLSGGNGSDGQDPISDYGGRDGHGPDRAFAWAGGLSPNGGGVEDEDHDRYRHLQDRILWQKRQAGLQPEDPQQQQQQQQQQEMGRRSSPGEAAVATLLSFRYPQSSILAPSGRGMAAAAADSAQACGERRHGSPTALDLGAADGEEGGGGGLSVCGALFALFLSACPLVGSRGVSGNSRGRRGCGNGAKDSVLSLGASGYGVGESERAEGAGGGVEPPGVLARKAVLAGEVLKAVVPFLLEPPGLGQETPAPYHGVLGDDSALTCDVDAIRVQELLCSVGRVLADTGAAGKEREAGRRGADRNEVPQPVVSTALQLLLLISPTDLAPGEHKRDVRGYGSSTIAATTTPNGLTLPRELFAVLRHLVWDAGVAERRPSLRSRLRPYLARADPEGAGLLQAAQNLTKRVASVIHCTDGDAQEFGRVDGERELEKWRGGSSSSSGGGCGWSWVHGALQKVDLALPLLGAVDEPQLVGVALALWFSAADAAFSSSGERRDINKVELEEARRAEGVGAKIVVKLVRGAFGERASAQAMDVLDSLTASDQATARPWDQAKVPTSADTFSMPPAASVILLASQHTSSVATAMIRQGLEDPRQRSAAASRSRAALAVILGGESGRGGGETSGSEGRQYLPSAPPQPSPLFSAVVLRAAETMASAPGGPASSPAVAKGIGSCRTAASARRIVASSCNAIHDTLRSDGDVTTQGRRRSDRAGDAAAAAAVTAETLAPTVEAFATLCRGIDVGAEPPSAASRPRGATWRGATAGAVDTLHVGGGAVGGDPRSRVERGGSGGAGNGDDLGSWRDAQQAVSSLLDFVDGFLETREEAGLCGEGDARGLNGRPQQQQQQQQQQQSFQVGDNGSLSPYPWGRQQQRKGANKMGKDAVRRMWVEVRGLCGGASQARAASSRRLADLLQEMAVAGGDGGLSRAGRDASFPFLFLEDPLQVSLSGTAPIAVAHAAAAKSGESGAPSEKATEAQPGGRPSTFTAEHVRNLADVAGSPSLEAGLRRAAAEQLRAVLVSPGVAAAVVSETRSGGEESNICDGVLGAALSGLLPPPPSPRLPHDAGTDDQTEQPWPSPPHPSPLPAPASMSSPSGRGPSGRRTRGGFGDHQWDEAFLGLLSVAVWQFADVRRSLLGATAPSGGADGDCSQPAALEKRGPGRGAVSPAFEQATRNATAAETVNTAGRALSGCGESTVSGLREANARALPAVTAILRRLYHPRPSLRRLAGSIAVRLAFDTPSFFSPLADAATSCRTCCCCPSPDQCPGSCGCDDDRDDDGADVFSGGDDCDVMAVHEGAFVVPPMVLEAYPFLAGVVKARSSRGGDGGEEYAACEGGSLGLSRSSGRDIAPNRSHRRYPSCPGRHPSFRHLVASEWGLLQTIRHRQSGRFPDQQSPGRETLPVEPDFASVARRLAGALEGAGRRSEFATAMLEARTWMLADSGYAKTFFGHEEIWQPAFERFLKAPPSGNKDRAAMRDVAAFLSAGTEFMCPRGFQVLADAAENCFAPILTETGYHGPTTVLSDYLGEWKTPSKKDSPRDLESKRRLRESVLELLVAVVSSTRPGAEEAAESLAASSLPTVIWRDILEGGQSGGVAVLGWSWWERGDAEGGSMPLTARRLAADFLTAVARRRGISNAAVAAWENLHVPLAATDSERRGGGGGGSPNFLAAAGWGDLPARSSGPGPAPLLAQIVRALARHASAHRSPDGFRGRASLVSSLVALQTLLLASSLPPPGSSSLLAASPPEDNRHSDKKVLTETLSPALAWRGSASAGSRDASVVAAAFGHRDGSTRGVRVVGGVKGVGIRDGEGGGGIGGRRGQKRLGWVLRLACHRDATVRALSFGILAEVIDEQAEDEGGLEEEEEEAVRACVRAALDSRYESPAVVTEALRFLSRHVALSTTAAKGLPGYATDLSASLSKAAASALTSGGGGDGESAAGLLSVAAASLRFVLCVVVAARDLDDASRRSSSIHRGTDGPGDRDEEEHLRKEEEEEEEERAPAKQGLGERHRLYQQQGQHRRDNDDKNQRARQGLGPVLEALWASGCLEACVHVVGDVAHHASSSGPLRGGWKKLVASSSCTPSVSAMALRSAQAAALALLRVVVYRPRSSNPEPVVSIAAAGTPSDRGTPLPEAAGASDAAALTAESGGTGFGGGEDEEANSPADVRTAVREALLRRTPLLAGLVRCLVGATAAAAAAAVHDGIGSRAVGGREAEGAVFIVREACATLTCLLSSDVTSRLISGDGGGRSEIPQAVFVALGAVLGWGGREDGGDPDDGLSSSRNDGCQEEARTEAKLLLSFILALPTWRRSLDLGCPEAMSMTAVILKEEARHLDRTASSSRIAEALSSGDRLRRRCLAPLLESSEDLRGLALASGLIGDLCVALEALLGQMTVIGHGRETFHNASKHLETLKAKTKRAGGGSKPSPTARGDSSPPVTSGSGEKGKAPAARKPPIPTVNGRATTAVESLPVAESSKEIGSRGKRLAAQRARKPSSTRIRARTTNTMREGRNGGRWSASSSPPPTTTSSSVSPRPTSLSPLPLSRLRRPMAASDGASLEREFYQVATLMVSVVEASPEGQREALRLRLPQFLWKAWPSALASQLAHGSSSPPHHHREPRGEGSVADGSSLDRLECGARAGAPPPLLLQALLGMASCVANGFSEGKKAFIFAGSEGSSSPQTASGAEGGGEWPRSSRSLLHRVAALALSSSPPSGGGGRADGSAAGPYGRAATEAACEVVRSCVLSSECRTVLSQSGFFVDAIAQISRLCEKALRTRVGTAASTATVGRASHLAGVLVNSSLKADGQKALMQLEGAGDVLGDLVAVCLRATSRGTVPAASPSRPTAYSQLVTRTLLLVRNLALAASTGQVAAHRESIVDLVLRGIDRDADGAIDNLAPASASCLRAVLRGSSSDGSGKTAVGVGERRAEVAGAVEACLSASFEVSVSSLSGDISRPYGVSGDAKAGLQRDLLAVKALL